MKIDWQKTAAILFCLMVALLALFLVGKYLLAVVLPFVIALCLAMAVRPAARQLSARTRMPQRVASILLLATLLALLCLLSYLAVNRLLSELARLADGISREDSPTALALSRLVSGIKRIVDSLPFLSSEEGGMLAELPTTLVKEAATHLMAAITSLLTGFAKALPSLALFLLVTVIAAFYFAWDLDAIHCYLGTQLPAPLGARLPRLREGLRRFVGKYVRAYLFLMFITFCFLFGGFTVLSVDYALLLALIIAIVDLLPVLGVGTVLVPWSLVSFVLHDFRLGFGLLILWGVITVVHQIAEPRLVGDTLGLHPVIPLMGMYVGYRLFGLVGMVAAPIVAVAVKLLWRSRPGSKDSVPNRS